MKAETFAKYTLNFVSSCILAVFVWGIFCASQEYNETQKYMIVETGMESGIVQEIGCTKVLSERDAEANYREFERYGKFRIDYAIPIDNIDSLEHELLRSYTKVGFTFVEEEELYKSELYKQK